MAEQSVTVKSLTEAEYLLVLLETSSSPEKKIQAIMALAASRGTVLKERLILLLVEALGNEQAVSALADAQRDHPQARWLFAVPEVRAQLERLPTSGAVGQEIRTLLTLGERRYDWPRFWPEHHPAEDAVAQKIRESLGWQHNPFPPGAEQAEKDPELPDLFGTVELPAWAQIKAAEPTLLCAVPGCGQTALLLGVARLQTGEAGAREVPEHFFPIWLDARTLLAASTRWGQLQELAFATACAVLGFLARNPFAWDETSPVCRYAIAHLVGAYRGLLGDLAPRLQAAGLKDPLAAARLAQAIAADSSSPPTSMDETRLMQTMAEARPAGFWGYLFVVDVSSRHPECAAPEAVARRLQPLIALMPELAAHSLLLKIGVPEQVGQHLQGKKAELARWPTDWLAMLLQERVARAGGNLGQLFDRDKPTDLEQQVAVAASGSPRRLMQLGNTLLKLYAEKEDKLTGADLAAVIAGHHKASRE